MTEAPSSSTTGEPSENYFLLLDPEWEPSAENQIPPMEAVIGLWPVEDTGEVARFRSNPDYRPRHENSPSDPIDALVRLAMAGEAEMEQLQLVLRDSTFDLAMNGDNRPLILKSPDGMPCIVVATSAPHQERVSSPEWLRVDVDDLVLRLTDGTDVLVNPGGPAAARLTGDFVRETALLSDEEVAAAYRGIRGSTTRDDRVDEHAGGRG